MSRRDQAINLHSSGVASLEEHSVAPAAGHPWSLTERFEASLCQLLGLTAPGDEVLVESPIYEPIVPPQITILETLEREKPS